MGLWVHVEYGGDWWGEDPLAETDFETPGELFRALSGRDKARPWIALGRCTGSVYVDGPDGPMKVGWIFTARNPEPVNRGDTQPTGLREAWVTIHDEPPTVIRTMHYHSLGAGPS